MTGKRDNAHTLLEQLCSIGSIKVWSLAVTVIGDLSAQGYGKTNINIQPVEGTTLNPLFQRMGIRPEALRVALHRLRKDGWVTSQKTGRTSTYQLSELGRSETSAVWEKVYMPNEGIDGKWQVVIYESAPTTPPVNAVKLASNIYIVNTADSEYSDKAMFETLVLPLPVTALPPIASPAWVEKRILTDAHVDLAVPLSAVLSRVDADSVTDGDKLDLVAIRLLALHHWRRIALRQAAWVHMQQYEHGVIRQCHDLVHTILADTRYR